MKRESVQKKKGEIKYAAVYLFAACGNDIPHLYKTTKQISSKYQGKNEFC